MKTMPCDICGKLFSAETFEDWFEQMKVHYMAEHTDFMQQNRNKPKEEGERWMADMRAKFEALPNDA